jgi:hypothetical protein
MIGTEIFKFQLTTPYLMEEHRPFDVIVRRRVPYMTTFLFTLSLIPLAILFILEVILAGDGPDEIVLGSIIVFAIVFTLYLKARLYKKAVLTFGRDNIRIQGNRLDVLIPVNLLANVYCMDSSSLGGEKREKLTIYFRQKNLSVTRVQLRNYLEAENFMEKLMQYDSINFNIYDFDVSPDPENEE